MIVPQYAVDAVALGSLYALTALGIGLTFGVRRLINFAHDDFVMAGGYALTVPSTAIAATLFIGDWPWPAMILAILLIVMLIALLTERIAFRPLRGSSPATLLISSFAASFALQQIARFVWNSDAKGIGVGNALNKAINIGALRITGLDIITMAITLVLLVGLVFFLKFTRHGLKIRAASEDFEMARLLGVKANTVIAIAFALSGALAGVVVISALIWCLRRLEVGFDIGGMEISVPGGVQELGLAIVILAILMLRPRGITKRREINCPFGARGSTKFQNK